MSPDRLSPALTALTDGRRGEARAALMHVVRADPQSPAAWLALACAVDDPRQRADCLRRAARWHAAETAIAAPPDEPAPPATPPDATHPLEISVVGEDRNNRQAIVARLHIREPLCLRRDPANAHDPNAIRVERCTGEHFGFLSRALAAQLAPLLDTHGGAWPAVVTRLEGGLTDETPLEVCITIPLPEALHTTLRATPIAPPPEFRYFYDTTAHYAYLLLDCSERRLTQIREHLEAQGLTAPRLGASHRPASNGRKYRWFVRLPRDGVFTEAAIDTFFAEAYGLESDRVREREARRQQEATAREIEALQSRIARLDEDHRAQEKQRTASAAEMEALREQLARQVRDSQESAELAALYAEEQDRLAAALREAQARVRQEEAQHDVLQWERDQALAEMSVLQQRAAQAARQNGGSAPSRAEEIIGCLLPTVTWVNGSLERLLYEFPSPLPALGQIFQIVAAPGEIKAKRLQSLPDWRELHCSTGRANTGRLYFRHQQGQAIEVLLGFKGDQPQDIAYLKRY